MIFLPASPASETHYFPMGLIIFILASPWTLIKIHKMWLKIAVWMQDFIMGLIKFEASESPGLVIPNCKKITGYFI